MRSFAIFLLLALASTTAFGQGGPPLVTNDPDTPGAGNWEINLAGTGLRQGGDRELALPDLDINYGLGERMQLSVHLSEANARANGGPWSSGIGPVELAWRWRFLDEEKAGVSLAIQPHWSRSWSRAAIRKGLAPEHDEFGLPLQAARHFGKAVAGLELGRNFIAAEPDEWQLGAFWSRDCFAKGLQCLAEAVTVRADGGDAQTLLNVGSRYELGEHLVLLGSLGKQLSGADQGATLFYLGVQMLH